MKVSNIMTPTVLTVDVGASVTEAAKRMKEFDVGFLAVVSDFTIVGTLTDRDIVVRALAEDRDAKSCLVKDIASRNPVTCRADAGIDEAIKLFSQNQVQRILVVDNNNSPVGVISLGDLAAKVGREDLVAKALKQVKKDVAFKEAPQTPQESMPTEIASSH